MHRDFVGFAENMLQDPRARTLFGRMAQRANIERRFCVLSLDEAAALYRLGAFPSTAERMRLYERFAPVLLRQALDALRLSEAERRRIRHVIVTSCTGLYAPGLDFAAIEHLGLSSSCERTIIGFMGCYAAMNALKQARHIVRSHPGEDVLMVNLELCTLHLQETQDLGQVLSFLIFGDGCAASVVSSEAAEGSLALDGFEAIHLPETSDLITWRIGDGGFDMVLSGQAPVAIGQALAAVRGAIRGDGVERVDLWAVHPGGRSVLEAVEEGLELAPADLRASREVLRCFGNMSSATVMFVLERMMRSATAGQRGCAMAFGPGLTAETMRFHVT